MMPPIDAADLDALSRDELLVLCRDLIGKIAAQGQLVQALQERIAQLEGKSGPGDTACLREGQQAQAEGEAAAQEA